MTYAPVRLLELRAIMRPITGLPDSALGITPDPRHDGGYHCGWDDRRIVNGQLDDYSWEESPRDWNHRSNAARAFDLGMFPRLREFSIWMAGQCEANRLNPAVNPDCADVREIIYSPDGRTVVRWDRLRKRSSGDKSHLTHTHFGFFADAESNDKTGPFRRFFDMEQTDLLKYPTPNAPDRKVGQAITNLSEFRDWSIGAGEVTPGYSEYPLPNSPAWNLAHMQELLKQHAAAPIDPAALAAAIESVLLKPNVLAAIATAVNADAAARMKDR